MMVKAVGERNDIDCSFDTGKKYSEPVKYGPRLHIYTAIPDGNALLRQGRDEVPNCTLSCPCRIMADCHCCCNYERLRLPSSARDEILLRQTLF